MTESPEKLDAESVRAENERLKQAVDELSVLNEIFTAIGTNNRVDKINKLILTTCIRHFNVEEGVIHTLDPSRPEDWLKTVVRKKAREQHVDHEEELRLRLGISLRGWLLKYQKPLVSNDVASDERFPGATKEEPRVRSVLAAPLRTHDRLIGILSLFNKREAQPFTAADQRLLTMIATETAQVLENARAYELEKDMLAARAIQQQLLPRRFPQVQGLDLFGFAQPVKAVGGDYFDFLRLPNGCVGCVIADVSGKGMGAALTMVEVRTACRQLAMAGLSPGALVESLNQSLASTLEPDRFVTLIYAVADPMANQLVYANAGHNPPLLWRAGGEVRWLAEGGLMLSPISRGAYREWSVELNPGDGIVLYTDGITEAEAGVDGQWGVGNLQKAVMAGPRNSARTVGERIKCMVGDFISGHEPFDDMALAVLVRTD